MDAVFGSSDAIVPMKRKSVFTVDAHEEDMLNFGFDFTNYEFPLDSSSINFLDNSDNDSLVTSSSSSGSSQENRKKAKAKKPSTKKAPKVKKSSGQKNGSKLDTGELICCSSSQDSTEDMHRDKKWAPNLSRKFRDKLYAFPSFDKCDSLLFFPQSMSRHLNCGDYRSLVRLMNSHLHRDCSVRLNANNLFTLPPPMFVKLLELMNVAHPDSMMCVHATKVVDNEIGAKMYFKFTDSQVINQSLARTVSSDPLYPVFIQSRSDRFKESLYLEDKSEAEKQQLNAIVDSQVDLIVYGRIDLKLRFDASKKVVGIDFFPEFTSLTTTEIGREMDELNMAQLIESSQGINRV